MTTANTLPGNLTPAQLLYPDLGDELATTRRMLERVPDGNNDWAPHTKSMKLASLADHVAGMPQFTFTILSSAELDFETHVWPQAQITNNAERLAHFDAGAKELSAALEAATWQQVAEGWTMRSGSQVYITGAKAKLLRTMGLSHMGHHRAQLGVYLRELGIAIPGAYGPSADEM